MHLCEMERIMRLVQRGEGAEEPREKAAALEAMCREIRAFVEEEAWLCGSLAVLMENIGESPARRAGGERR